MLSSDRFDGSNGPHVDNGGIASEQKVIHELRIENVLLERYLQEVVNDNEPNSCRIPFVRSLSSLGSLI